MPKTTFITIICLTATLKSEIHFTQSNPSLEQEKSYLEEKRKTNVAIKYLVCNVPVDFKLSQIYLTCPKTLSSLHNSSTQCDSAFTSISKPFGCLFYITSISKPFGCLFYITSISNPFGCLFFITSISKPFGCFFYIT